MSHYFLDILESATVHSVLRRAVQHLLDWEEDDHDPTQPVEDAYRPEAGIDNAGMQPFVIFDLNLYLQRSDLVFRKY